MKLKVLGIYPNSSSDFICKDDSGRSHYVDLYVNGDLTDVDPDTLIGKTVEVEYLHAHIEIAVGVRVLDEAQP